MFGYLLGLRKLLIILITIIISSIFVTFGLIDGKDWVELLNVALPAFFATNVGEHVLGFIKDSLEEKRKQKGSKDV